MYIRNELLVIILHKQGRQSARIALDNCSVYMYIQLYMYITVAVYF